MKQKADTLPLRRPAVWLLGLCLLAGHGCSGSGLDGGSTGETADPKLREIVESKANSREIRKAVIAELKQREQKDASAKSKKNRKKALKRGFNRCNLVQISPSDRELILHYQTPYSRVLLS
jgi:hypothetical protein